MTHTAQTLLDAALRASATGLVDSSVELSSAEATVTSDGIALSGQAVKDSATVSVSVQVADVMGLLGLIATSLPEAPKQTTTRKAKAKPAPEPEPEPEPVDEADDGDDTF